MTNFKKCIALWAAIAVLIVLSGPAWAVETGKININTAPVEELVKLKRIGPKYAQRIVKYREEKGLFKHPEDIIKVAGIGRKTWESNKERITVN